MIVIEPMVGTTAPDALYVTRPGCIANPFVTLPLIVTLPATSPSFVSDRMLYATVPVSRPPVPTVTDTELSIAPALVTSRIPPLIAVVPV